MRARSSADSTIASASISTSISGEMRRLTSTIVVAGRISPKNSPCALPTLSQLSMFVTYTRVRTTSARLAPARSRAAWMLRSACTACA